MLSTNEVRQDEYAGFWARTSAYFIDGAIAAFILLQLYYLNEVNLNNYLSSHQDVAERLNTLFNTNESSSYLSGYRVTAYISYYFLVPMGMLIPWLYYAGFESSPLRATPGKWLLGIYVTDLEGQRIGFGTATGRHFSKILSGLILCIGYMMAGFTDTKQALHDKIAGCLVWRR